MARIELRQVTRLRGDTPILDGVDLHVDDGEFVALIGSSGSGKTSIIRAIAGLDELDRGAVVIDGMDVTKLPSRDRHLAMVSQHDNLLPHRRVRGNLMFPLELRGVHETEARVRVEAESRANDLSELIDRWPSTLSGGQRRLAQIARALVQVPRAFLMDEPLENLDLPTRDRLRREIVDLQRGYGTTMVYASNRPDEIMTMPDRLVALDAGRIVQTGSPLEVRSMPSTLAIAQLTGALSTLQVTVQADGDGFWIRADGVRMRAWAPKLSRRVGRRCTLGVRLEDVRVLSETSPTDSITLTVGLSSFQQGYPTMVLESEAGTLHAANADRRTGERVSVSLDRWLLFDDADQLIASSTN